MARRLIWTLAALAACARAAPAPSQDWKLDRSTLDVAADPCTDFYQYACGGFATVDHVPAERGDAGWAVDRANLANDRAVHAILAGGATGDAELARLRTFYGACMARDRDRTAAATLRTWLDRVDAIASRGDVVAVMRQLHGAGLDAWFRYSGEPDPTRRTGHRGEIDRAGIGSLRLHRDTGGAADARRAAHRAHIVRMLELAGGRADAADAIVAIDDALAAAVPPDRDDPAATEHAMTPAELAQLAPHLEWPAYLALVGHRGDSKINVVAPSYLAAVDAVVAERPIPELASYLRWQVLRGLGAALPGALGDEHYRDDALAGVARGSRDAECTLETLKVLGVELSRQFAARYIGASRDAAREVADRVRDEIVRGIGDEPWLSPAARTDTADKLRTLVMKLGYPDRWPEVGAYPLAPDRFLDNLIAARGFEQQRSWHRVQRERRRDAWENIVYPNAAAGMAAARLTIPNGFPDPLANAIVFTAAMLQPPLFDARAPLEVRYGNFGSVVGHELIHILEEHEFDAAGELRDTWSPADVAAHDAQRACVVADASRSVAYDDVHIDGAQTYSENVADLGGLLYAYAAFARAVGAGVADRGGDGLSRAQRFFVAYAQYDCRAERPAFTRANLRDDPHAPARYRVDGPLSHFAPFAAAFACRPGAAMVAADRCTVW